MREHSYGMENELNEAFPAIEAFGRKNESSSESRGAVSVETCLRREVSTYPMEFLGTYHAYLLKLRTQGENGAELILAKTAESLGFSCQ